MTKLNKIYLCLFSFRDFYANLQTPDMPPLSPSHDHYQDVQDVQDSHDLYQDIQDVQDLSDCSDDVFTATYLPHSPEQAPPNVTMAAIVPTDAATTQGLSLLADVTSITPALSTCQLSSPQSAQSAKTLMVNINLYVKTAPSIQVITPGTNYTGKRSTVGGGSYHSNKTLPYTFIPYTFNVIIV
jgi:hypothetical protein